MPGQIEAHGPGWVSHSQETKHFQTDKRLSMLKMQQQLKYGRGEPKAILYHLHITHSSRH